MSTYRNTTKSFSAARPDAASTATREVKNDRLGTRHRRETGELPASHRLTPKRLNDLYERSSF